jgi:hypothetical protein
VKLLSQRLLLLTELVDQESLSYRKISIVNVKNWDKTPQAP